MPQSSPIIRVICWLSIAGIVALMIYNTLPHRAVGATDVPSNPTLPILGRYIIGTHKLLETGGKADPLAPLIVQMDDAAKSPADKLRVVIISREVESADAASKRLAALLDSHPPAVVKHDAQTVAQIFQGGSASIPPADLAALRQHHEWFANVILTNGLPDSDPARAKVMSQAKRTVYALAVVGVGGALLLVVAFALFVLAIVLGATGKLRMSFVPSMPGSSFLEAFAIYLVLFLVLSLVLHVLIAKFAPNATSLAWSLLLTPVPVIGMLWPVIRGKTWAQTLKELGWHRGRGVFIEIGSGIVGYIASLPFLAVMLLLALGLSKVAGASPTHPIVNYVNGGPAQIALLYFIACVWAPVVEETMFRGALFSHLRSRHGWLVSAPIVGFIFAAVHPQGWTLIPALGGIGVVLCGLREWRGSLIASMAAHALNNGTVMTILVLTMG